MLLEVIEDNYTVIGYSYSPD